MRNNKAEQQHPVDFSAVTPATGKNANDKPISDTLANTMPTSDMPASEKSHRSDPDKTIPGPEAVTGVDGAEESQTCRNKSKKA